MPKQLKTPAPYLYEIPPFKGDPEQIGRVNAIQKNEYFLIESLLRSKKAEQAYAQGGKPGLGALFRQYGIIGQEPLSNSHHRLLMEPLGPNFDEILAASGYVDAELLIRDLGVLVKRPANTAIPASGGHWSSAISGEEECLNLLRNPHPRHLYLQIDISQGPTKIIHNKRLHELLKKQYKEYRKMPPSRLFASYARWEKTPFRQILNWFNYFKCYDLQRIQGLTPAKLAMYVYNNKPTPYQATQTANTALKRAAQAIKAAEQNTWPPVIR